MALGQRQQLPDRTLVVPGRQLVKPLLVRAKAGGIRGGTYEVGGPIVVKPGHRRMAGLGTTYLLQNQGLALERGQGETAQVEDGAGHGGEISVSCGQRQHQSSASAADALIG